MQEFKWIEIRPGKYKTVPLSDDRPAVNLPNKPGIPNLVTTPSWVDTARRLMPEPGAMNAAAERKATDAMLAEREKEVKYSSRARSWEKGRRKEWAANKPYFMRDRNRAKRGGIQ